MALGTGLTRSVPVRPSAYPAPDLRGEAESIPSRCILVFGTKRPAPWAATRGAHYLRAASHPIGQRAAVKAMPVGEFQKLLAIDLIRQNPQRLISLLRKTQMTQGVNQPLSAVRHRHHRTRRQT
jgi:hypothetical protein